jgi:8-amino-7-oxononanoate synthase
VSPQKQMTLQSPIGAEMSLDGRRYINFGGSSYLGLACKPEILEVGADTLRTTGAGYQFPWFFSMVTRAHQQVVQEAATFFGSASAVYLPGGYHFGFAALAALRSRFSSIFFDEVAHYSLREAIAASGLRNFSFRHLDAADLGTALEQHLRAGERPLVVTDGLYSSLGEIAPLEELAQAMRPYDGRLLVDESHSFGVLGALGRGACERYRISAEEAIIGGSMNKAFGVTGGLIPASEADADALRETPVGRGASPGLAASAAMCAFSLKYVREHPQLLQQLRVNVRRVKEGLRRLGLEVGINEAPIAGFTAGGASDMEKLQARLLAEGIFVPHLSYIGAGSSGVMRCGIFADHTEEHIGRLLESLGRLL